MQEDELWQVYTTTQAAAGRPRVIVAVEDLLGEHHTDGGEDGGANCAGTQGSVRACFVSYVRGRERGRPNKLRGYAGAQRASERAQAARP